jgi:hypothetical protein
MKQAIKNVEVGNGVPYGAERVAAANQIEREKHETIDLQFFSKIIF